MMRRLGSLGTVWSQASALFVLAFCAATALPVLPGTVEPDQTVVPALPEGIMDVAGVESTGRLIAVAAGGDLQAALDKAEPGDVIELTSGAIYRGPFHLPAKQGEGWITIRSDQYGNSLPGSGRRVTPDDSEAMATLMAWPGPVISTTPGAAHYRFVGIRIRGGEPEDGGAGVSARAASVGGSRQSTLVDLAPHGPLSEDLPQHIIFDRCYLQGAEVTGTRRGIAMNAAHVSVINSHLSGFLSRGEDAQAIAGWEGPGPYSIINNYLEASGENVMFGGADPETRDRVPSDIEIRGNHFAKLPAWRPGDASHSDADWDADWDADRDADWTIKNLFELKNARRVLIEGNLFEYNWPDAQSGFAILFTVRNQDGRSPWSVVEDVTFRNNIIQHVAAGINILGRDDINDSRQSSRILIDNNLFLDVGGDWGSGRLFQLLNGTVDVQITNNTAIQKGNVLVVEGDVHRGFVFAHNVAMLDEPGVVGTGTAPGRATLEAYFDDPVFHANLMIGNRQFNYPPGNDFVRSLSRAGFVDPDAGDYRRHSRADSRRTRRDDVQTGVDFNQLCAALSPSEKPVYC